MKKENGTTASADRGNVATGVHSAEYAGNHSEGPWTAEGVCGSDYEGTYTIGSDNEIVAYVHGRLNHPQIKANASLIAASPTMLAELRQCAIELEEAAKIIGGRFPGLGVIYGEAAKRTRLTIELATSSAPGSPVVNPPSNEEAVVP